jgi:transcriptional regulator with XRE-family HTH domain
MGNVGQRLLWLRQVAGISGSEVARLAGVSRAYPNALERGKLGRGSRIGLGPASKIAGVFGVSTDWFALGEGSPPSEQTIKRAVSRARKAFAARAA